MTTYKDIVKDIFDSVNYNANEQEISKAKNVLIKDLKDVPVGQFLFIEDGSIDLTELKDLKRRNPEIKIVVYIVSPTKSRGIKKDKRDKGGK